MEEEGEQIIDLQGTKGLSQYDCWSQDLYPEDWKELCLNSGEETHAKCPFFKNSKYIWVDAKVVDYDHARQKFKVIINEGQKQISKYVSRLSLYFKKESLDKFRERIAQCKMYQQKAEEEMRFIKLTQSIDSAYIQKLPQQFIQKIYQEVFRAYQIKNRTKNDLKQDQSIFSIMIKIVSAEFKREMKKICILTDMQIPQQGQFYSDKRVEIRSEQAQRYSYDTLLDNNLTKKYQNSFQQIRSKLFVRKQKLEQTIRLLQEKSYEFQKVVILDLISFERRIPFTLQDFSVLQREYFERNKESVRIQWREYLLGDIIDIIRNAQIFQSQLNDINDYKRASRNSLERFLHRIDFSFRNQLKGFFINNCERYTEFLQKFIIPEEGDINFWTVSQKSLITLQLKFTESDKRKREKEKKGQSDQLIFFEPSYESLETKLIEPIHWLQDFVCSIECLETDITRVLGIQPYNLLKLSEEEIIEREDKIRRILSNGFKEPFEIINAFRPYDYLLEQPKEEIIRQYFERVHQQGNLNSMDDYLLKLSQSIEQLNQLFCDEHKTTMFLVKTQELKEHLVKKASDIKKGLLKKISQEVNNNIEEIRETYNQLKQDLTTQPNKEEELVELNKLIHDCDGKLDELDLKTQETYSFITLMEKYGEKFEEEAMISFWLLKVSPVEVRAAQGEGKRISSISEQQFMQKIEQEKTVFETDLTQYKLDFEALKRFEDHKDVNNNASASGALGEKIDDAKRRLADFNRREQLFEIVPCRYEGLEILQEEFQPYRQMWDIAFFIDSSMETWNLTQLSKLSYKKISQDLELRKKQLLNLSRKFEEEENPNAQKICKGVIEEIKNIEKGMPLLDLLTRDCMLKKSHNWKKLFQQLNVISNQQTDTYQQLLQMGLMEKLDVIFEFVSRAEKEYDIEVKLQKDVIDKQKLVRLELEEHSQSGSYIIIKSDNLQELLDDQLNTLVTIKMSPFIGGARRKAEELEKKIIGLQDLLDEWIFCQRTWLYLNPIFASEDLKKKMPVEKKMFDQVDSAWKAIMSMVVIDSCISENYDWEKSKLEFEQNNKILDQIQKSLSDYLEAKREDFPRFYFLSDEELIEIISKTKDPKCITKYLNKCFEGIYDIDFLNNDYVTAFKSDYEEKITLIKKINVNEGEKRGNVEKWLLELEDAMKQAIREQTQKCAEALEEQERSQWLFGWPGQCILAIDQVKWSSMVEQGIADQTLDDVEKVMDKELSQIVDLVRGDLSALQRLTLSTLIVIEVHQKYVLRDIIEKQIKSVNEFDWISQLRYKISMKTKLLKIQVMLSNYDYQYEYLGNTTRLVITPLTDRCYRTLISAYQYYYGGAPEGPAGTGKTETVKDLAKAVAVQCIVFNCTDQINYVAMSKLFKGLSQAGAWCCFDEFNRIAPEVLSVIAEQVRTIQQAIRENRSKFFFEGKNCKLLKSCSINITMNPGYAGRSELPDNLKALFRSCAMMIPDYSLISEISLYSSGFQTANAISSKIVGALKLGSEQLSSQKHYDFGMRALKTILVAAGVLKKNGAGVDESSLCLKALKDVNIPKLVNDDIPLFEAILSDLFPGVQEPSQDTKELVKSIREAIHESELIAKQYFIDKVIQLQDTLLVRHGLMLVGETCAGKSKSIETLQKALIKMGRPTEVYVINPKAVTPQQLYGNLDQNTKIWTDGVIPKIMKFCESEQDVKELKWVTFDGPVDAVWIENMNTVLDDNKMLCLTNGQKIKLTQWMTMMFEVEDLFNASPATVSRCGIIYMQPDMVSWLSILEAYLQFSLKESLVSLKELIKFNLQWFLSASLQYVSKMMQLPIKLNKIQLTQNVLTIFKQVSEQAVEQANGLKLLEQKMADVCLYAIIWGIGGTIDEHKRNDFNVFLLKLIYFEDVRLLYKLELDIGQWEPRGINVQLKDQKNLFMNKLSPETLQWSQWAADKFIIQPTRKIRYDELIIPTAESQRTNTFVKNILSQYKNIMLIGPTGTGKTIGIITELNKSFNTKEVGHLSTGFSGQTKANAVQRLIESKMTTRKGKKGHYGPEDSKQQYIFFIDDVNMPSKEEYGAQPPIELLRMLLDHHFMYDIDTLDQKHMLSMNVAVAMGPPSTGRNEVTQRFLRHFFIHYICPFDNDSMQGIFGSILEWQMVTTSPKYLQSIVAMKDKVVKATLELFSKIKQSKELFPTPLKSHYLFSMRDISKVFQTLQKATAKSFKCEEDMVKLWAYECSRVFMDRLISKKDQQVFLGSLKSIMRNNFQLEWSKIITEEHLIFTNFIPTVQIDKDGNAKNMKGVYSQVTDFNNFQNTFENLLNEYNEFEQNNKLNIVLFMEAMFHVVKIVRVITTNGGHCLLAGLAGLGRQTLCVLATFVAGLEHRQFESSSFSIKEWLECLQNMLKEAGLEDKKLTFMIRDSQLQHEDMLEHISALLNSGQVPGLYPPEERAKILDEVSSILAQEQTNTQQMTNSDKLEWFARKCRDNVHLVLCFSPVDQKFKTRLRNFPSLINCTTIDWFMDWPAQAFQQVSQTLLKNNDNLKPFEIQSLCQVCVEMHEQARDLQERYLKELRRVYYVTPMSFLQLTGLFKQILDNRAGDIDNNIKRYVKGVAILEESKIKVEEMKQTIIKMEPKLQQANIETQQLIKTVQVEKQEADEKRKVVEQEEQICNQEKQEAEELRAICQEELNKVEPLLDQASKNLKSIQRSHIDFIKQMKNPLPAIARIFQALCILFKIKNIPVLKDPNDPYKKKPDYATPARNIIMAKPDQMLNAMLDMNADFINTLPSNLIDQLKELESDPVFNFEAMDNAAYAAGKIFIFINTVVEIYDKLQIINPKREALKQAQQQLKEAQEQLNSKKKQLKEVMDKIGELESQLENEITKKDQLDQEIKKCKSQLKIAEGLVIGLEGEKINWQRNVQDLQFHRTSIISDSLLSAGFIAYLGIFPVDYRQESLKKWTRSLEERHFRSMLKFELRTVLSNEIDIGMWTNKYRLPNDSYSIDNAVIIFQSGRFSLIIDPQIQANRWLKLMYKTKELIVLRPNMRQSDIINQLTNAIELGLPVLFENIDNNVPTSVQSIFENKRKSIGRSRQIKFLDKWVDINEGFKFYTTTKLSRPSYSPDICVMVTILNFMVTQQGLEDQLLNTLVSKEDPNSEKARINNIKDFYELKKKQKMTEDTILSLLANSQGNILDDITLLETLKKSNLEAKDAALRITDIETMKRKLQNTRSFYKKAANRASHLFFCLTDLSNLEPMYQFSLEWFNEIYIEAINMEPKIKETRVKDIMEIFTKLLFNKVSPSLFEKDKLLFAFMVVVKTLICEEKINDVQLRRLLLGFQYQITKLENPLPQYLNSKQWSQICALEQMVKAFEGLSQNMGIHIENWKQFFESQEPQLISLPQNFQQAVNDIDQLTLFKIIRPDKFMLFVQEKIRKCLGDEFVEFTSPNIEQIFKDSKATTPIIIILSPGSDPLNEIIQLSLMLGKSKYVDVLSLGQGQEQSTVKFLETAQAKGRWVILQNCHLAPKILNLVEKALDDNVNAEFRLWLTSMPSDRFPVSMLQNGIKVSIEPPCGVKQNVLKNIKSFSPKQFEHQRSFEWKRILINLIFFHSVIQERRKFGSLGWNIPYEFSQADLMISTSQINNILKQFEVVPWEIIYYSIAEANYGGRVTDPQDRRLMNVLIRSFVNEDIFKEMYNIEKMKAYPCPGDEDMSTILQTIKQNYPLNDQPCLFGLHNNAEITYGINQTAIMMETLISTLPRQTSSGGISDSQFLTQLCDDILKKIPNVYDIEKIQKSFPITYENSMNTVLIQELQKYNNLNNVICSTIIQLQKALEGLIMMSEDLDQMYTSMIINKVPELWQKHSYPSIKSLAQWIDNFQQRLQFMQKWIDKGQPNVFWISGLFFTQSFITGVLQNYARLKKLAIDSLTFQYHILDKYEGDIGDIQQPQVGAYIYGLYLEGAKWSDQQKALQDSDPKILFTKMPIIYLQPLKIVEKNIQNTYLCPVYKTTKRSGVLSTTGSSTNFVINIDLPHDVLSNEEYWVKRGVALLCDLDD